MEPLIPSVFALCGLLLGWVVRDFLGKRKLDPNLLKAANEQIEAVRQDLGHQLELERSAREEDRRAFTGILEQHAARVDYWIQRAMPGGDNGAVHDVSRPPTPPPTPPRAEERDVAHQFRLATEGPEATGDATRQALMGKGLTPAEADAILQGEYSDLPESERLDLFVQESIRDATGVQ